MTLALGFIVGGGLILLAGLHNRTITEVLQGVTSPVSDTVTGIGTAQAATPTPTIDGTAKGTVGPKGLKGNRALGYQIMAQRYPHWAVDPHQWHCLDLLWTQESHWDEHAQNPTSSAAGIPQDITGNLHGGAKGQIIWGLDYIHDRYGSPCAAWQHEKANNWY